MFVRPPDRRVHSEAQRATLKMLRFSYEKLTVSLSVLSPPLTVPLQKTHSTRLRDNTTIVVMVSVLWYLFCVITDIGTHGILPSAHYPYHRHSDNYC